MEKASRFHKQPKIKQKEYFEILQRRQQNGYYGGDNPQSLHQLKIQRGAMVQRSYSDAMFRQNKMKSGNNKQPKTATVSRNNSNVSASSKASSHYSGQYPAYPAGVQRSYSDGIRLVDYRGKNNINNNNNPQNGTVRTNHNRPNSVDLARSQSTMAARSKKNARPASVDLDNRGRPRSILKKSSSFNDLNNNHSLVEQDLIFDDDYVSPRDLLSASDHGGSYRSLNYSFEGELQNDPRQMRAMSPKTTKRVNFTNQPTYHKTLKSNDAGKSPGDRHFPHGHPLRRFNSTSLMEERILQQQRLRNQQKQQQTLTNGNSNSAPYANGGGGRVSPVQKQYSNFKPNSSPRVDTDKEQQPFEIRKPLMGGENNVVDFGTFISKKLSKFKFGSKKKVKKNESSTTTTKENVRTSHDDNFTMLSGQNNGSPQIRDNFINQEVLY